MLTRQFLPVLGVLASCWNAGAQVFTSAPGILIPDQDGSGVVDSIEVALPYARLETLRVGLRIANAPGDSAWNGDLYAYLYHEGTLAVLLNRPGKTATNPDGDSNSGLDVWFSTEPGMRDIHLSGSLSSGVGTITGLWSADGRSMHPDDVTEAAPRDAGLFVFDGMNPNGLWVLFVADRAGGNMGVVEEWSLSFSEFVAVPEPDGLAAVVGALVVASVGIRLARNGRVVNLEAWNSVPMRMRRS